MASEERVCWELGVGVRHIKNNFTKKLNITSYELNTLAKNYR